MFLGALALAPPAAMAEPPNLNVLPAEPGVEFETTGYWAAPGRGAPGFQFNTEVSAAISRRFGLQAQLIGSNDGRTLRAENVSLQAFYGLARWSDRASLGVSVEAAADPRSGDTQAGGLVYATAPVGPLDWSANLGAERAWNGSDASLVYAWRLAGPLAGRWSWAAHGGGSSPLKGDEAAEHYAGPALAYALGGAHEVEVELGYLAGLTASTPGLAHAGFSFGF